MRRIKRGIAGLGLAWMALVASTAVLFATEPPRAEPRKPQIPVLKVEKYSLPNGLTILLHEDHKTPVVAVNLWYRVGSKDEKPGRTGFAHLFEHMMFQGSKNHDRDYFMPLEKLGAELNGTTAEDQTMYYETVPKSALELALWLEADRMGFLPPAMTQAKLDNQRDVVKNERRQTVDNVPYGQAEEVLLRALYPAGHPYHHSVIGSMADLSAARLSDVTAFFRTHYVPNKAILCVAGDFQPAQARLWIEKYFAPVARGPELTPAEPSVPSLSDSKHIRMTDAVSLPRAQLIWTTVPANHPDEPALDVLASILGGLPKENRLFRALIYDRQLAAEVEASHPTLLLSGTFEVELYARPGQKLDDLVRIADAEIERLKREGPTAAEVRKAQNERESALIMGLQSVTRKASVLNQSMGTLGDPLAYRTELEKVFLVTPADVTRVARKYVGARRIELDVLPGEPASRLPEVAVDPAKQAPVASPPIAEVKDLFDRSIMPGLGATPHYSPPRFERRKLSNGLELRIIERHDLPIVTFDLVVKSGETLAPAGKEGLGSIAASLLDEGTKTRDALQVAGELAEIGASLGAAGGLESTTVSLTTLTRHLDQALELYTDVILNPVFPDKELNRLKLQRLAQLKARADDAEQTASAVFPRLIYGVKHPYGRPDLGTPGSVRSITRDDAVAFTKRIMVPGNAVLVVVGDVRTDAISASLETRFRTWAPGPVPQPPSLAITQVPLERRTVYMIDKPAAAQSVLTIGKIGASRRSPDFFALTLMNAILGGQFVSRINMNLREDKGYSYGAESSFSFLRGPGPFEAGGTVQTAVTKESLVELLKELTDITGRRPVTEAELAFAKQRMIQGFPSRFETTFGVAGQVAVLVADELPDDEFNHYQSRIEAVAKADVDRVARAYITPEKMAILVVGDRAQIERPLESLSFVKTIQRLDPEGNSVTAPAAAKPAAAVGVGSARRSRASAK
ncbi:MAG: M16 family metallopeptidase [Isosphaerales bacterium]